MSKNPYKDFHRMLEASDGFEINRYQIIQGKVYAIVNDCKYHVDDLNIFFSDEDNCYYYCIKTETDFYYDKNGKATDNALTDALNDFFNTFPECQDDYYDEIFDQMENEYVSGYADYYDSYGEERYGM